MMVDEEKIKRVDKTTKNLAFGLKSGDIVDGIMLGLKTSKVDFLELKKLIKETKMDKSVNGFELSQLVGTNLNLVKKKATRVTFGDEIAGVYFGKYDKNFDEYVEKLKQEFGYNGSHSQQVIECYPNFATDMNNAWLLVEAMEGAGFSCETQSVYSYKSATFTYIKDDANPVPKFCSSTDMPTAILKAVAKALGVLDE
jgi:hypothetical protein